MRKLTTALALSALALTIGACKDEPAKPAASDSRSEVTGTATASPARGADGMDGSGRNGGAGGRGGASMSGGKGGAGGKGGDSD